MRAALSRVHGSLSLDGHQVEAAGRTDGAIARDLLIASGHASEAIDARADDVIAACCDLYDELCPADLSPRLAPGVPEALTALGGRPDAFRFSLVTGNFERDRPAQARAGGDRRLVPGGQGGFGSDAEDRALLPPIARARAGGWPRERTVVIGDTPRDIACARADGLRVVAVATGPFGVERWRMRTRWSIPRRRSCRCSKTGSRERANGGWVGVGSERARRRPRCARRSRQGNAGRATRRAARASAANLAPCPAAVTFVSEERSTRRRRHAACLRSRVTYAASSRAPSSTACRPRRPAGAATARRLAALVAGGVAVVAGLVARRRGGRSAWCGRARGRGSCAALEGAEAQLLGRVGRADVEHAAAVERGLLSSARRSERSRLSRPVARSNRRIEEPALPARWKTIVEPTIEGRPSCSPALRGRDRARRRRGVAGLHDELRRPTSHTTHWSLNANGPAPGAA